MKSLLDKTLESRLVGAGDDDTYWNISNFKLIEQIKQLKSKPVNIVSFNNLYYRHKSIPSSPVSIYQAQKDFRREKVVFNGIPFIPNIHHDNQDMFVLTLNQFIEKLLKLYPNSINKEIFNIPRKLSEVVMQNSCRTSAGADSYFILQELFNSISDIIISQTSNIDDDLPITIDLFFGHVKNPQLLSRVKIWNSFSIYDSKFVNTTSAGLEEPAELLEIESLVIDEYNFATQEHCRYLHLYIFLPSRQKFYHTATDSDSLYMSLQDIAKKYSELDIVITHTNDKILTSSTKSLLYPEVGKGTSWRLVHNVNSWLRSFNLRQYRHKIIDGDIDSSDKKTDDPVAKDNIL